MPLPETRLTVEVRPRAGRDEIAGWLEQSVNSDPRKRILIYNFADAPPLGGTVSAELAQQGFTVTAASRKDIPRISARLLAEYSQLWLFFDGRSVNGLSDEELKLISDHNAKSRGRSASRVSIKCGKRL
jgi:hypothetical protein